MPLLYGMGRRASARRCMLLAGKELNLCCTTWVEVRPQVEDYRPCSGLFCGDEAYLMSYVILSSLRQPLSSGNRVGDECRLLLRHTATTTFTICIMPDPLIKQGGMMHHCIPVSLSLWTL